MSDESNNIEQIAQAVLEDQASVQETLLAQMQGYSEHALDEKSRLILPARFLPCFKSRQLTITRGFNNTLWILHPQTWARMQEKIATMKIADVSSVMVQRFFAGSADTVPVDGAGRFMIPQHLRKIAMIQPTPKDEKAVVLQGLPYRIEVWSMARWQAYNEQIDDDMLMKAMEATGFSL